MQPKDAIEFWFAVGSTYTYLTVARIHQVAADTGVRFAWRPFSVRTIMQEMNNIPFNTKPVKLAYMWRDIERRSSKYGLPIKVPQWRDGAKSMFVRRTDAGSSKDRRQVANQISRRASVRSDKNRAGSFRFLSPILSV